MIWVRVDGGRYYCQNERDVLRYIIVDLEATCDNGGIPREEMEIIEIGAVEMLSANAEPSREFSLFVQPILHPVLTEYCFNLTSILQSDIVQAEKFIPVFQKFMAWIGPEAYTLCSWGNYDLTQFLQDFALHGMTPPEAFDSARHINLKKVFADRFGSKQLGMKAALRKVGLPLLGRHHRGIDDAHNIAALARLVL